MNISELFIRRPVFATVVSLILMLLGLVSYDRLSVREYPAIDEPVVTVTTVYRGASASVVEREVTQPLEDSMAGIEGIEVLSSASRPEESQVTARFTLETDPDVAASDVRDRVGRARGLLPDDVDEPIIAKVEADAQPIMYIAFKSDRMSALEITDYLDRIVTDRLQNQPGVAQVSIFGGREYSMRIWIDRLRLAAYNLTVQDVENAIRAQNAEIPSGRIESLDREFTVLAKTALQTPEEFENIIVKQAGGFQVRLAQVARVEVAAANIRRSATYNGETSISLGVVKQATANPLEVAAGVRRALEDLAPTLPVGMSSAVGYDTSIFIAESISSVYETIGEAIVLVVLVIFVFLRTLRASFIPVVTIPISLITSFAIMLMLGFSINTLTLLAMVLAIGLVVDDAIVMLENIYRHIEEGMTPFDAAIAGSKEITFAVIAMTLTLAAVYAPVGFAEGRTGKLFLEFALTLAGTVVVSGFVALTLTPMLCSKLLRHEVNEGRIQRWLSTQLDKIDAGYKRMLGRALAMNRVIVGIAAAVALSCVGLFFLLQQELAPVEDRGTLLVVGQAPQGATLEFSARYAKQIESIYIDIPEVAGYLVVSGFPQITDLVSFSRLVHWSERSRTQQEIVNEIQPKLARIPGILAFGVNPPSLGQSGRSQPVEYVIQASGTYEELDHYVELMMNEVRNNPGFVNPDSNLKLQKPQLDIQVNRSKVVDAGIDVSTVGRTLETLLGGRQITRYEQGGQQYDVIVQVGDEERRTPGDISNIYVRGGGGEMVQLSNLLTVNESVAPNSLNRFNQLRAATISANLAPGYSMGQALNFLDDAAARLLPSNAQTDVDGQLREFVKSSGAIAVTFVLALLFIYLVLAAQFESFVDPLIILVSVPLSLAGALLLLFLTNTTLNIYSQVGLITLVGLISKHGILIVEFSNQLRAKGHSVYEAVVEAAGLRLRPILMTTGAMVLGALPLALASGAGAESRRSIGLVIVGGISFGTLLTLFVVPTVYLLIAGARERRVAAKAARVSHAPAE
ncbi:efflux RND transporter permease subunit [Parvibaculum sp.]|uniref:efflux RND transporter permease subunit n=1 Tax=Parvibaculum sp. TaxID=2024848 RepID=UPI002731A614|nr:efflux RND transporter permease subunit [Parvibaculum sp.]MDP1628519.1 efflux RND transporter permease subunit [Parvibaculum sp.]MDP2151851.1 efflux RND transporter permease subunit [Parvibaculum sp.]MDP3326974.1 efflux RND transporter permease subunit [Parvibaculum sp.]